MKRLLVFACLASAAPEPVVEFGNVASTSGMTGSFPNGGSASKRFIIETTGSGSGLIDFDNDGFLDAILIAGEGGRTRLYRNNRKGGFIDVTAASGVSHTGWGQGVCAGDFDNDGLTDMLVTYWGKLGLYRNRGGMRFEDAKLAQDRPRYNTGCAFLDYDRDGDLDLFVANYLKFDPATTPEPGANPYCWYRGIPVNCGPRGLPFDRNILYRNNGDGTFTDVSNASGISKPDQNYSLGVVTGDFDRDGDIDIYVACDTTPSILYINRGDGTFEDEALFRGAAFDDNGKALSGMGVAAADYDGDGWLDIFRTNFSDERETLYRNRGRGNFDDRTIAAGLAHNTRFVGWGCEFLDFDNDGWRDLVLVNGHAFPEVDRLGIDVQFKERAILYRNLGTGKFADVSEASGPAVLEKHSARGLAVGDIDNDGSVEVLVNNQNEPPSLWRNTRKTGANWVLVHVKGKGAIGAKVSVTAAGRTQTDEVRSGGSYLSQSDFRLHFGLGEAAQIDRVVIEPLLGTKQELKQVKANRVVTIRINQAP